MKEVLQQVKEELEKAYDHPQSADLDRSIEQLQAALEQYGDKGTMLENCITSLTQARNAMGALENAGDISSAAAFGQAYNALEHAIESYTNTNHDPLNL
jgi:ABC-type transporter Mla subunit MlaD